MGKIESTPLSLLAAADLTGKRYLFGKVTSTGINVCSTAGERADCIIGDTDQQSGYGEAGDAVDAYVDRKRIVQCGGTITRGDKLATTAAGKALVATTGQHVNAIALEDGVSDGYIEVLPCFGLLETDTESFDTVVVNNTPGALPLTKRVILLAVDGTDAYTLADGYLGQELTVFVTAGANTPVATITPATPIGYATVTALGALGDLVSFVMTEDGWAIVAANGVTFT